MCLHHVWRRYRNRMLCIDWPSAGMGDRWFILPWPWPLATGKPKERSLGKFGVGDRGLMLAFLLRPRQPLGIGLKEPEGLGLNTKSLT